MFLGHFGVAMGAKAVAPGPSLGTTILAAQWADGLWPIFVLLGLERVAIVPGITRMTPLDFVSYPYSHSLVADAGWALDDAVRRLAFAALVVLLAVLYVASAFGPPPPGVEALAITGLLGWLFVAWGYWIDRHRTALARLQRP